MWQKCCRAWKFADIIRLSKVLFPFTMEILVCIGDVCIYILMRPKWRVTIRHHPSSDATSANPARLENTTKIRQALFEKETVRDWQALVCLETSRQQRAARQDVLLLFSSSCSRTNLYTFFTILRASTNQIEWGKLWASSLAAPCSDQATERLHYLWWWKRRVASRVLLAATL